VADNFSSSKDLFVVMTTVPAVDGDALTSSSCGGFDFYFQFAVLIIGVIGTATNALILYALVASKQHRKHVLIANQNALDLFSCLFLAITYAVKLCNIQLAGRLGYWLCMLILNYNMLYSITLGSIINLLSVTVERYLRIVHPVFSKNKLKRWKIYSAAAFSWIFGFIYSNILTFSSTAVIHGVCYGQLFYDSRSLKIIYGVWTFTTFYVIVLLILIFCYGRILVVIRHQASVMASHSAAGPSTAQTRSKQIQSNVIKTMIFVSVFYAVSWAPTTLCYLLVNLDAINMTFVESGFYATQLISFLYICTNPLIYAIKLEPVKRVLVNLFFCRINAQQPAEYIEMTGVRSVASRV